MPPAVPQFPVLVQQHEHDQQQQQHREECERIVSVRAVITEYLLVMIRALEVVNIDDAVLLRAIKLTITELQDVLVDWGYKSEREKLRQAPVYRVTLEMLAETLRLQLQFVAQACRRMIESPPPAPEDDATNDAAAPPPSVDVNE